MVEGPFEIDEEAGEGGRSTIVVRVVLESGAGRPTVSGREGRALRVRVAAPPGSQRAAAAGAAALAEAFGVAPERVGPIEARPGRVARYRIEGVTEGDARRVLERVPGGAASARALGYGRGRRR
jgi:uncharacterized protein YggU (UPF0235/DUF167 family)